MPAGTDCALALDGYAGRKGEPGDRSSGESWEATCEAIALLSQAEGVDPVFGIPWRHRAAIRLQASLNRYFCPKPDLPTDERTALALIKSLGMELQSAGRALDDAAYHLREGGNRKLAQAIAQAAHRAHTTAQGLLS